MEYKQVCKFEKVNIWTGCTSWYSSTTPYLYSKNSTTRVRTMVL